MVDIPHNDCQLCETGNDPFDCHYLCQLSDDDNEQLPQLYQLLIAAAQRGDIPAVLRIAPAAKGFVSLNEERGSIQIKTCDREYVIANLPLRTPEHVALGNRFRDSQQLSSTGGR
ncbi:MAG TPA: hypothetical protein VJL28_00130 [Gemmatimonadaceae bacterium]|nr:hypothetical protein [Gemmatimonadaceae bacterium]HLA88820.1 hypothetical protein [Gemmatimonadaceae bacterium]